MFLLGLLPGLATAVIVFYVQRRQNKNDAKEEGLAKAKRAETKLSLDLQMATAKLSYAVAMAVKRGTPNGEIEEGIKAYKDALEEFQKFEREQLSRLQEE